MTIYGAGNIQINFPTSRVVWPFLLAGYGATNKVQGNVHQAPIGVLILGGGVKFFLEHVIALRIEYRFQQWSGGEAHDVVQGPVDRPYSVTHVAAVDYQYHSLVLGTSIFF